MAGSKPEPATCTCYIESRCVRAHGEDEWVAVDSLEPYYRLVLTTASVEL